MRSVSSDAIGSSIRYVRTGRRPPPTARPPSARTASSRPCCRRPTRAVEWAASVGLTSGREDGTFGPDEALPDKAPGPALELPPKLMRIVGLYGRFRHQFRGGADGPPKLMRCQRPVGICPAADHGTAQPCGTVGDRQTGRARRSARLSCIQLSPRSQPLVRYANVEGITIKLPAQPNEVPYHQDCP